MIDHPSSATQVTSPGNYEFLRNGVKAIVAVSICVVAFGGCVASAPSVLKVLGLNERTTSLETRVTAIEEATRNIAQSLKEMSMRHDLHREADRSVLAGINSQLTDISGKLTGVQSSVAAVQYDASGRASMIENQLSSVRQTAINALSKSDELEGRVSSVEVRQVSQDTK